MSAARRPGTARPPAHRPPTRVDTPVAAEVDLPDVTSCRLPVVDPSDDRVWPEVAHLTRNALTPAVAGVLPRPLATGLLTYDQAPDRPRGAELATALLLAGPWIAGTTGWALVVAAGQATAAVTRWLRS